MLASKHSLLHPATCRTISTVAAQQIDTLPNTSIDTFRERAFRPELPILLPRGSFKDIPAIQKWFRQDQKTINASYLARFGSIIVPLEFSTEASFSRLSYPLSFFLECIAAATASRVEVPNRYFSSRIPGARTVRVVKRKNAFFSPTNALPDVKIYLAQAPIAELPRALRDDLAVPELVQKAGKGDVYDSSIWIGQAPTYTPLHRDPNPNLFVQLAGSKTVRIFRPKSGSNIFAKVQEEIGGQASQAFRGEEMMHGAERAALEKEAWDETSEDAFEATLNSGDALFIPKGWWHSFKSVGTGINGSVCWKFQLTKH